MIFVWSSQSSCGKSGSLPESFDHRCCVHCTCTVSREVWHGSAEQSVVWPDPETAACGRSEIVLSQSLQSLSCL